MSSIKTAVEEATAKIGTEVGVANWITVDQKMIDDFAKTTFDEQWIHVDPERAAKETPFGGAIAHGFLTLSLASRFAYDCFAMKPVVAGSRLRGRFTLKDVSARDATSMLRTNILTIEIEGEETPALIAEWLGLAIFKD
jgi:acyl dehydratase